MNQNIKCTCKRLSPEEMTGLVMSTSMIKSRIDELRSSARSETGEVKEYTNYMADGLEKTLMMLNDCRKDAES